MRSEWFALGALSLLSCATAAPTHRAFSEAPDELFTAAWLALENEGAHVTKHNRVEGQLAWANGEVTIASQGAAEVLTLTPADERLLDAVERRVRSTLRAWQTTPEWTFDAGRNLLYINGFSVELPREWAALSFDTARRRVTVQETRGRSDGNLTLVAEVERRDPHPSVAHPLQHAVETLLNVTELGFEDDAGAVRDELGLHGQVEVALKSGNTSVSWQAYQRPVGDFQVTLVMACPEERAAECEALWKRVQQSALTPAR